MESTKHTGSCHCGAVAFEVTAAFDSALSCNCSHCLRKGFLLAFVPKEQVNIAQGADNLTEYKFGKKKISHLFCKTCGVQAFGFGVSEDGTETAAINLRCIHDLDLESIPVHTYNGKDA